MTMNTELMAAGILAVVVGLVHSVLGEHLIFKHLRENRLVPTRSIPPLRERNAALSRRRCLALCLRFFCKQSDKCRSRLQRLVMHWLD